MIMNYLTPKQILKLLRFWPPFLGARVSVESVNDDFNEITVVMKHGISNSNIVGTHFGGSLYSMCDPFFMFIILEHLKDEHIVWDQSAKIVFRKPARGKVRATFKVSHEELESIREKCKESFNYRPSFSVDIIDSKGQVVATVEKTLYVRRKDAKKKEASTPSELKD